MKDRIWDKAPDGQFVVKDDAARESFATAVEGLPAVTVTPARPVPSARRMVPESVRKFVWPD